MSILHRGSSELKERRSKYLILSIASLLGIFIFPVLVALATQGQAVSQLAFIIPLFLCGFFSRKFSTLNAGIKGENKTLKAMKLLPDTYHVFNNVYLDYEGNQRELDCVVVGENGIFVVETKNHNGFIEGDAEDREWIQNKTGRKGGQYSKRMKNPMKQLNSEIYMLSKCLKSENINSWVAGLVLFTNDKCALSISGYPDNLCEIDHDAVGYIKTYIPKHRLNEASIKRLTDFFQKRQRY